MVNIRNIDVNHWTEYTFNRPLLMNACLTLVYNRIGNYYNIIDDLRRDLHNRICKHQAVITLALQFASWTSLLKQKAVLFTRKQSLCASSPRDQTTGGAKRMLVWVCRPGEVGVTWGVRVHTHLHVHTATPHAHTHLRTPTRTHSHATHTCAHLHVHTATTHAHTQARQHQLAACLTAAKPRQNTGIRQHSIYDRNHASSISISRLITA